MPLEVCTRLFLWIAKCCPRMEKLTLFNACGTHYTNVIFFVQALPNLAEFEN